MGFSDYYCINPFFLFEGFNEENSLREGKMMRKIWGWIFGAALISMFWIVGSVEANGSLMGLRVSQVNVGFGQFDGGSNHRSSGSVPYRCAEESKPWQVPKPQRKSIQDSKCKRARRIRSGGKKFRNVQIFQEQKRGSKARRLEKESIDKIITRKVGSVPILEHYIKRMGIISIIDRMVASHPNRKISHGETAAAVMIYLLNGGKALYQVENWANGTDILTHIFSNYQPEDWTDDRIDDTLDELYKAGLEPIQGSISANIIQGFGVNLNEIHYDTTSVLMWGTYNSATAQPAVLITFGHSKAHRPDLKQIMMGTAVAGDGGVPIVSGTHDGNTSDSVLPISYWERLRQVAGKSSFCFIGDCKIASVKTLKEICTQDGQVLSPLAMTTAEEKGLIKRLKEGKLKFDSVNLEDEKSLRPIYQKRTDCPGNRKKEEVSKAPEVYKACQEFWEIEDNKGRPHTLRKLIIHSEELAQLNARTRKGHIEKAEGELQVLCRKLKKDKLKSREAIEACVDKVLCKYKVQGLVEATIVEDVKIIRKQVGKGRSGAKTKYITEEKVNYNLQVHRNQQAIEEKALVDGIFLMVSNHESQNWPIGRLLALYKRQYKVERIFSVLKGPLAVSPMLLEKPERICSMMFIMTLTLQLYTLIQRQVAQELCRRDSPLEGLMPNKIKTWRPQTDKLLEAFNNINLVEIVHNGVISSYMTSLNFLQLEILQLLGVPANKYSLNAFT